MKFILSKLLLLQVAEFSIVLFLLLFWLVPSFVLSVMPESFSFISMLILCEFLFGHANVGLGLARLLGGTKRNILFWGLFLFYSAFFIALILNGLWLEVLIYLYLLFSRIYRSYTDENLSEVKNIVAQSVVRIFLLLICALPAMVPWPNLGFTPELAKQASDSGLQGDLPGFIVWLSLYFILAPIGEKKIVILMKKVTFFDRL